MTLGLPKSLTAQKVACALLSAWTVAWTAVSGAVLPLSKASAQSSAQAVQRPPQFVLLAFDGSKSNAMWKESQQFAKDMEAESKHVRFTYFINTAYYLSDKNKRAYDAPNHGPGKSAISFGGTEADVLTRFDQTNLAHQGGHEIASHAVGHWHAGDENWSEKNWQDEFRQFFDLLFDVFKVNSLPASKLFPSGWTFGQKDIIGFRAPQLGMTPGLWPTLKAYNMRYDTSKSGSPSYWPDKNTYGTWNFPLAQIKIAGTAKKTLSMDYNFMYSQCGGEESKCPKDKSEVFYGQMLNSYLSYFESNYTGNRAPINIGHHFSQWNQGAYWRAMKDFARAVCGLPEVKCVTYKELADYMDGLDTQLLSSYKKGGFQKGAPSGLVTAAMKAFDYQVELAFARNGLVASSSGADAKLLNASVRTEYFVNGYRVSDKGLTMERIREMAPKGGSVEVGARVFKANMEIASRTHKITGLGTPNEQISPESNEELILVGDLPGAHLGE